MAELLFFVAGFMAVAGAVAVVMLRNPFFSVLALIVHLISLATLFLLLAAEFLAAAQLIVYAGAVMVLYLFVVSYIGGVDEPLSDQSMRALAPVAAGSMMIVLGLAIGGSGLQLLDTEGVRVAAGFGSPAQIGELLLTKFLLPFELASFLLTIAAVCAVVLSRRRRGLEPLADQLSGAAPPRGEAT